MKPKSDLKSPANKKVKAERLKAKGDNDATEKPPSADRQAPPQREVKAERLKAKALPKPEEDNSAVNPPHSDLIGKSEIENPKSEIKELPTEPMEVHHHPNVEKKGFKEYILEGLMIFLAVLMGFIAENIREGITEQKRATEFARLYYGDIKKDTLLLHQAMRFSAHKIAAADSLVTIINRPGSIRDDPAFYTKSLVVSTVLPFEPSTGNYEQIKSSGAIHDFKPKMIEVMNEYDLQARRVVRREEITQKFATEQLIPFAIDNGNMEVSYDVMTTGKIVHDIHLDWNPALMKRYKNIIVYMKILTLRSVQEYKKQLVVADKVLAELKKEYDLEDE